jgi:hypothetical protein
MVNGYDAKKFNRGVGGRNFKGGGCSNPSRITPVASMIVWPQREKRKEIK